MSGLARCQESLLFRVRALRHTPRQIKAAASRVDFKATWRRLYRVEPRMCSELECGVCYRTFNAGRRCPRELHCKHSFCESCLRALARPGEPAGTEGRSIICPLCRQITPVSAERKMRAELRVDEGVLDRLLAAGVLDREEEREDEEDGQSPDPREEDEQSASVERSVSPAATTDGSLRGALRTFWKRISGKRRRRGGRESK